MAPWSSSRFTATLERVLRLGRGELRPGLLLFAYLFLVSAACTVGRNTRDALFLARFDAVRLPYADLAVVVAVTLAAAAYMRVGRSVSLRKLLVGSLVTFALSSAAFWWLLGRFVDLPVAPTGRASTDAAWLLLPAVYVWVGIVGVLAPTQVWTLANYVLTLRQAKRLFAIVGSGSILGWIAGGAGTAAISRVGGTEVLLLVMAAAFAACAPVVPVLCKAAPAAKRRDGLQRRPEPQGARGLGDAASTVLRSPYLRLVGVLIALGSLVATIAGWQLKAIAKETILDGDQLAAFFGSFSFFAGLAALAVQLAITAPVLRRLSLGAALSIVPLALALGSGGLLAWGSLAAVVLLKGSDQVLRYSIDKSAVELLYLPVSRAETFKVKSFLDTVVCRLGDGLASLLVLLFARRMGMTPVQLAWLTLALVAAWLVVARAVQREYLRNLAMALRANRVDVQGATAVLDRATTQLLAEHLRDAESKRVLSALSLVESSPGPNVMPNIEALLAHPSAAVRARALTVLARSGPASPPTGVEALLSDPDLRVRSAALLYMAHAGLDPLPYLQKANRFDALSVRSSLVVYYARPGPAQNLEACRTLLAAMIADRGPEGTKARTDAARLLASLPRQFKDLLAPLLDDEEIDVVRHAVRAAGRARASRFVPRLLDALASPALAADAAAALARFGNPLVPRLADALERGELKAEARCQLPAVLLRIATPAAEQLLASNLLAADDEFRFQVVSALTRLKRRHPEPPVDQAVVEKALVAEMLAHYRGYLVAPVSNTGKVADATPEMQRQLECIFRLLQLLLPGRDINSAYVGLQSPDPVIHDKALELLDNILAPQLRRLLVPLLDGKLDSKDRAVLAARVIHHDVGR